MVLESSIRIGGDEFDEAIIQFIKKTHSIIIGERSAEDIKMNFIDLWNYDDSQTYEIKGRDTVSGLPRIQAITKAEMRDALEEPIGQVIQEIKQSLDQTPAELAADIMDRGIVLSGGGALIKGFKNLISDETGVPILLAQNPLTCVVNGAGKYLNELKNINRRKSLASL